MANYGNTTPGASTWDLEQDVSGNVITVAGSESATDVFAYCAAASGQNVIGLLLNASTGAIIAQTPAVAASSTPGWVQLTFSSPIALSAGNYIVGVAGQTGGGALSLYFDTVTTSSNYKYAFNVISAWPTIPDPVVWSDTSTDRNNSLYLVTSADAANVGQPWQQKGAMGAMVSM